MNEVSKEGHSLDDRTVLAPGNTGCRAGRAQDGTTILVQARHATMTGRNHYIASEPGLFAYANI